MLLEHKGAASHPCWQIKYSKNAITHYGTINHVFLCLVILSILLQTFSNSGMILWNEHQWWMKYFHGSCNSVLFPIPFTMGHISSLGYSITSGCSDNTISFHYFLQMLLLRIKLPTPLTVSRVLFIRAAVQSAYTLHIKSGIATTITLQFALFK